jgi:hypothetical protein
MAINFQQVFERIRAIGLDAPQRREALERLRAHAWDLFQHWAEKTDELNEKLERARQPTPPCAAPSRSPARSLRRGTLGLLPPT